jgi:hypothetical protein
MSGICGWVKDCNKRRWLSIFSRERPAIRAERHERLVGALKKLQDALEEFKSVERVKLIKPYEKLFDPDTLKLRDENTFVSRFAFPSIRLISVTLTLPGRSLFTAFVFIQTLDAFSEELVKFMTVIVEIDQQRTKTRFWFPGRVAKVKENLIGDDFKGRADPLSLGAAEDLTSFIPMGDESETFYETTSIGDSSTSDVNSGETERVVVEKKRKAFLSLFFSPSQRPIWFNRSP